MSDVGDALAPFVRAGQRAQFAHIFDELSPLSATGEKLTFAFVALGADFAPLGDAQAYAVAFRAAASERWLGTLLRAGIDAGAFERDILTANANNPELIKLQGLANALQGFMNAQQICLGLMRSLPKICFIRTSPSTGGSGFLVGADTVLTAWHVIAPMLDPANGEPIAGSEKQIEVFFDYYAGGPGFRNAKPFSPTPNWLLDHSPCTAQEAQGQFGVGHMAGWINQNWNGQTYLDFAAIRLQGAPGRERGAVAFNGAAPAQAGSLFLLQHPSSSAQSLTNGNYNMPAPASAAAPRFHHLANAAGGSSGGLCFNHEFEPFGLHQAAINNSAGQFVSNAGVPGPSIVPHLLQALTPDPANEPLWRLSADDHPVLGRVQLVALAPRVVSGERPILIVRGQPRSGLSFSLRILRQLSPVEHHFIAFKAEEMPAGAAAFGAAILAQCGEAPDAGPPLPAAKDAATTASAWLRDQFWPIFTQRLNAAAQGRTIWLVIDNLEKYDLAEDDARDLLEFLCAGIRSLPFLRCLLIGLRTSARGAVRDDFFEDDTNEDVERALEIYLLRRATEKDVAGPTPLELKRQARALWRMALLDNPGAPLPLIARFLIDHADAVLQ